MIAEQYLRKQIKKVTGQLDNALMQAVKVKCPTKPWGSNYRVEVTSGKTQLCEQMMGGNKENTLHIRQDMWPHVENERSNTLLLNRLAWPDMYVKVDEATISALLQQANLVLSAQVQIAHGVM